MLLDETERTMDRLVAEIEGELDKAFDDGMKAVVGFSQPLIRAATLEEAATAAETRDLGDNSAQDGLAQEIAVAIRALAGRPADPT